MRLNFWNRNSVRKPLHPPSFISTRKPRTCTSRSFLWRKIIVWVPKRLSATKLNWASGRVPIGNTWSASILTLNAAKALIRPTASTFRRVCSKKWPILPSRAGKSKRLWMMRPCLMPRASCRRLKPCWNDLSPAWSGCRPSLTSTKSLLRIQLLKTLLWRRKLRNSKANWILPNAEVFKRNWMTRNSWAIIGNFAEL